ncbi:hypothetical protein Syun_003927 [Stephania yunnanensis]|uniref:Enolase N-terminal domain-containing protein n=1 Tax=Stephania yunnanensis TaxID=152371 RepID=A0AAP0L320_9MAGN
MSSSSRAVTTLSDGDWISNLGDLVLFEEIWKWGFGFGGFWRWCSELELLSAGARAFCRHRRISLAVVCFVYRLLSLTIVVCAVPLCVAFEDVTLLGELLVFSNRQLISINGLDTKVEKSRKQMKERKNRAKKIRGVKKLGANAILAVSLAVCKAGASVKKVPLYKLLTWSSSWKIVTVLFLVTRKVKLTTKVIVWNLMAKKNLKELGFVREQNAETSKKEIEVTNASGNTLPGSQSKDGRRVKKYRGMGSLKAMMKGSDARYLGLAAGSIAVAASLGGVLYEVNNESETKLLYSVSDPVLIRGGTETEYNNSISDPFLIRGGTETEYNNSVSDPLLIRDRTETKLLYSVSVPLLIRDGSEAKCMNSVSVPSPISNGSKTECMNNCTI